MDSAFTFSFLLEIPLRHPNCASFFSRSNGKMRAFLGEYSPSAVFFLLVISTLSESHFQFSNYAPNSLISVDNERTLELRFRLLLTPPHSSTQAFPTNPAYSDWELWIIFSITVEITFTFQIRGLLCFELHAVNQRQVVWNWTMIMATFWPSFGRTDHSKPWCITNSEQS